MRDPITIHDKQRENSRAKKLARDRSGSVSRKDRKRKETTPTTYEEMKGRFREKESRRRKKKKVVPKRSAGHGKANSEIV